MYFDRTLNKDGERGGNGKILRCANDVEESRGWYLGCSKQWMIVEKS